jgi:monoamine oxidase
MPKAPTEYDILIVGAGLAGLHCALRLSHAYPKASIAIAEAYTVGGRVFTYKPNGFKGIHWESGAGRIHTSHRRILSYIESFGLSTVPLSPETGWISAPASSAQKGQVRPNSWNSLTSILYPVLSSLPPKVLATSTLQEILVQVLGKERAHTVLSHFPYRAEVTTLRADLGIEAFKHEMGSSTFVAVKEGLSSLIDRMTSTLKERGVKFLLNHRLTGLSTVDQNPIRLVFNDDIPIYGKRVILAIPATALRGVSPFRNHPVLQRLSMRPLLRTYAIFPTSQGKSWFYDMPRIVTDSPLRHIIPINQAKGVLMTSYTDDDDTKKWLKIRNAGEKGSKDVALASTILDELRTLMPDKTIPQPLLFKSHVWRDGCTYWIPGLYSPKELSDSCMRPLPMRLPHLYLCGESYSMRQAWMEGALDHAEDMLQKYFFRPS